MRYIVAALLLLAFDASANTIALRHEILSRLAAANLTMDMNTASGCAAMDLNDTVIVACYGEHRASQYRRVMEVLADLNPVNKYSALLNSGHVEVR